LENNDVTIVISGLAVA